MPQFRLPRTNGKNTGIKPKRWASRKKALPWSDAFLTGYIRTIQYAGLVESMDDAVGVVLKALKESGLDKNTIVIFTGDNGGVTSGDNYSTNNSPLRGGKGYQWEGGIREPYFIAVPWMDVAKWEKGVVWINGHNLGRYWKIGPQTRLYCPAPWLKKGRNELIIFNLHQLSPKPVTGEKSLEPMP